MVEFFTSLCYNFTDTQKLKNMKFIEQSPKWDGDAIYRGIGVNKAELTKLLDAAARGKPIDMRGTSSWTTNKKGSETFAGKQRKEYMVVFRSVGKQNGTSVRYLSKNRGKTRCFVVNKQNGNR